jgi:hypothetical protein
MQDKRKPDMARLIACHSNDWKCNGCSKFDSYWTKQQLEMFCLNCYSPVKYLELAK